MRQYDEGRLQEELDQLPPGGRCAFASACAERQLRNPAVSNAEGITEAVRLLERLWEHLADRHLTRDMLEQLAQRCESIIPDGDAVADWTSQVAFEESAIAAAVYAFRCAASGDSCFAIWSARQALEALDVFVAERLGISVYDPPAQRQIASDPLVQAELNRQERDLEDVRAFAAAPLQSTVELRERSRSDARAFFG